MKYLLAILALTVGACAWAQGSSCESAAVAKKLTGTAKAAFVQKCEFDAKAMLMSTSTLAAKDKKSYVAPTSSYGGCEGAASDL